MMNPEILILKPQKEYELLDSGEGEKLERFGEVILRRPDPQALWLKGKSGIWNEALAEFVRTSTKSGNWKWKAEKKSSWPIEIGEIKMMIKPGSFKHVGIFPEQALNWEWLPEDLRGKSVLNLFGYTGGASIACAKAGAKVTHVDSSKASITLANENAKINGQENSIRWILEDAVEFVKREIKRGNKYDGIIMDPPTFGHGVNGELWKIEKQFTELVAEVKALLSDRPAFLLMSGYASGYSSTAYTNNILDLKGKYGGEIEHGELAIAEKDGERVLPTGIFARWRI